MLSFMHTHRVPPKRINLFSRKGCRGWTCTLPQLIDKQNPRGWIERKTYLLRITCSCCWFVSTSLMEEWKLASNAKSFYLVASCWSSSTIQATWYSWKVAICSTIFFNFQCLILKRHGRIYLINAIGNCKRDRWH
jgi:hypothetical protein